MFAINSSASSVMSMLQGGTAFDTSFLGTISSVQASANGLPALLGAASFGGADTSALVGLGSQFSSFGSASGSLASFSSHVSDHFTNLPQRMNLFASQLGVQQGLLAAGSLLPSLGASIGTAANACGGLGNLFGSIMGDGASLVAKVEAAIQSVIASITGVITKALAEVTALVQSVLSTIQGVMAQIETMIANEVQALEKALADLLNFAHVNSLFSLFKNPCVKALLNTVGTAGLISALAGA